MPGLFQGLEIGKRALLAHQLHLQTTGHNIANVNTPGYTRQRVRISPSFPEDTAWGALGTGVTAEDVRQVRDLFLGERFREGNKSLGQWTYKSKILTQIEATFAEPADNTLADQLNEFWNSWDTLSQHPNTTNRDAVLGATRQLINGFHQLSQQLASLRDSTDRDLVAVVSDVNRLATEIANLNEQIRVREVDGTSANDLRDMRERLVDELSQLVDVNSIESANGELRVFIGALEIVEGSQTLKLGAEVANERGRLTHRLTWAGTSVNIKNINGRLKGLLDARDDIIPGYISQLDTLAAAVVERVNSLHVTGYGLDGSTGLDFFDPNYLTAATIKLNGHVVAAPDKIAASGSGEPGDGTIALAIQDLRNTGVLVNGTTTINEYYSNIIGQLGVESHEALSSTENFALVVRQVENSRQSVEGVSLDEEMANMIKFQHAYDAAARIITAMDEALETVITRMGIVGT